MPVRPGISMSSRQTSAPEARAASTTSSPRPTWATTSRSGSRSSSAASAPRTSAWSSASRIRITAAPPPPGSRGGRADRSSVPPAADDPLAHAAQAVALARRSQPEPSSATASPAGPSSMTTVVACAWRTTLVTDSRSTQASSARWRGSVSATVPSTVVVMPASASTRGAAASSASRLPARRPPTVARTSASAWRAVAWIDSSSALARGGVDVDQPRGELGLDRERGQGVAEHVVDVAGHPLPLGDDGVLAERGVRRRPPARRRAAASRRRA